MFMAFWETVHPVAAQKYRIQFLIHPYIHAKCFFDTVVKISCLFQRLMCFLSKMAVN